MCAPGFEPRCALDRDDGSEERLTKILELIDICQFGIHDLSHMRIDPGTRLARHNMPFELGLFLGWKHAKRGRTSKSCLILDRAKWRYRKSLSDLSGRDIHVHRGRAALAIMEVRDWLATESGRVNTPGGAFIVSRYRRFRRQLPDLCAAAKRHATQLTFSDYREMVHAWLRIDA